MRAFGERLHLIGFVPTALAVSALLLLLKVDAPSSEPSVDALWSAATELGAKGLVAIAALALALSITLQPLQYRLVQVLEGYWSLRGTKWLFRWGLHRQRSRMRRALAALTISASSAPTSQGLQRMQEERAQQAETVVRERFPTEDRLLPTALGNVLRSAEDRVGLRYGIDSVVIWPRLYPLLPREYAQAIEDEVTQLDVSARLSVTWFLAALIASGVVLQDPVDAWRNPEWFSFPLAFALLGYLSYRAAVESALAHGRDIEVALDLHRDKVLTATRLPEPRALSDERLCFAELCTLLETYTADHEIEIYFRKSQSADMSSMRLKRLRLSGASALPKRPSGDGRTR